VDGFIFVQEKWKDLVIITVYGCPCLLFAALKALITIKVDIVMGGEIMIIPAQRGILFNAARVQSDEKK